MKDDMSGAGSVLAAMRGVGALKPNVNVLALIPAVENLIGEKAIHPGDVFKSYGGKTVEVNNTDAEGRLILADAVAYAREQNVDEIIDLATLTGACVVALGRGISGIMCTSDKLAASLIDAGKANGEELWRLPLFDDYKEVSQERCGRSEEHGFAGRRGDKRRVVYPRVCRRYCLGAHRFIRGGRG